MKLNFDKWMVILQIYKYHVLKFVMKYDYAKKFCSNKDMIILHSPPYLTSIKIRLFSKI